MTYERFPTFRLTIEVIDYNELYERLGVGSRDMGMVYEAIREEIESNLASIGVRASTQEEQ